MRPRLNEMIEDTPQTHPWRFTAYSIVSHEPCEAVVPRFLGGWTIMKIEDDVWRRTILGVISQIKPEQWATPSRNDPCNTPSKTSSSDRLCQQPSRCVCRIWIDSLQSQNTAVHGHRVKFGACGVSCGRQKDDWIQCLYGSNTQTGITTPAWIIDTEGFRWLHA